MLDISVESYLLCNTYGHTYMVSHMENNPVIIYQEKEKGNDSTVHYRFENFGMKNVIEI